MRSKFSDFSEVQQRLRRVLNCNKRESSLNSFKLSKMVVNYFERYTDISLELDFLSSLSSQRNGIDACTLLVAMLYIDQLKKTDAEYFHRSRPSDLYLSALIVAGKYLNDKGSWNDEWAEYAGLTLARVNELELELLSRLSWDTFVPRDRFSDGWNSMEEWIAWDNICTNPSPTYNDICILSAKLDYAGSLLKPLLCGLVSSLLVYLSAIASAVLLANTLLTVTSTPWGHPKAYPAPKMASRDGAHDSLTPHLTSCTLVQSTNHTVDFLISVEEGTPDGNPEASESFATIVDGVHVGQVPDPNLPLASNLELPRSYQSLLAQLAEGMKFDWNGTGQSCSIGARMRESGETPTTIGLGLRALDIC